MSELLKGWRLSRLGENLREPIRNGYSPVCPTELTGKWILHLGAVTPSGFNPRAVKPAPAEDPRVDGALLQPGDLLVSRSNTRERVGLAGIYRGSPSPCAYPDLLMRVRPADAVYTEFLGYTLLSPQGRNYFEKTARGTSGSMLKIDRAILESFPVLLPPLLEQHKIAAILSSVDDTIEKTQAVIDQLQVVKKAMMQELLTRGIPGRHTRFKKTEIGEVPEGWDVVPLKMVVRTGPTNGKSPPARSIPPGVPTFSIAAVRDGRVNILGHLKYTDLSPDEVDRHVVVKGDILIVRGNANPDLVGKCGMVSDAPDGCIYPDILMRVRTNERMLPELLVALWNADLVHDQILLKAKTTNGTYKINQGDAASTLIPVPTASEQRDFVRLLEGMTSSLIENKAELSALTAVKSALMSVLLTGELRVTPDDPAPRPPPPAQATLGHPQPDGDQPS